MIPWTWCDVAKVFGRLLLGATAAFILAVIVMAVVMGVSNSESINPNPPMWFLAIIIASIYLAVVLAVHKSTIKKYELPISSLGIISPFKKWIDRFFLIFFIQTLGAALVSPLFYANLLKEDIQDSGEQVLEDSEETEIGAVSETNLENPQIELITGGVSPGLLDGILLFLALCIITPFAEELFFRGMLHPLFRKRFSTWPSIVLGAAIFSVVHFIPVLVPSFFVLGLVLCWVREKSGSIVPGIVLHGLQNCIFVAFICLQ